jgi:hypothetical protein
MALLPSLAYIFKSKTNEKPTNGPTNDKTSKMYEFIGRSDIFDLNSTMSTTIDEDKVNNLSPIHHRPSHAQLEASTTKQSCFSKSRKKCTIPFSTPDLDREFSKGKWQKDVDLKKSSLLISNVEDILSTQPGSLAVIKDDDCVSMDTQESTNLQLHHDFHDLQHKFNELETANKVLKRDHELYSELEKRYDTMQKEQENLLIKMENLKIQNDQSKNMNDVLARENQEIKANESRFEKLNLLLSIDLNLLKNESVTLKHELLKLEDALRSLKVDNNRLELQSQTDSRNIATLQMERDNLLDDNKFLEEQLQVLKSEREEERIENESKEQNTVAHIVSHYTAHQTKQFMTNFSRVIWAAHKSTEDCQLSHTLFELKNGQLDVQFIFQHYLRCLIPFEKYNKNAFLHLLNILKNQNAYLGLESDDDTIMIYQKHPAHKICVTVIKRLLTQLNQSTIEVLLIE